MNDISEWYTPQRATQAEIDEILSGHYEKHADFLLPLLKEYGVKSVVEWGCGGCLLANLLPDGVEYLGVEKNDTFLLMARQRCKRLDNCKIQKGDIREYPAVLPEGPEFDLSMAWSFMKHFALDEWDAILGKVLAAGRFAAFNVQVMIDLDNGRDYHHAFVSPEHLEAAVVAAGHFVTHRAVLGEGTVEGQGTMQDVALWTRAASTVTTTS